MLCGQGRRPPAATIDALQRELGLDLIPGTGLLAAVVPGAFGGWMMLLRDYGTMPLARRAGRDRLRRRRLSAAAASPATIATVDRCSARNGRPRPRCTCRRQCPQRQLVPQPALADTYRRVSPREARRRRPRSADRGAPRRLLRGLRRRGDRPLLPHPRGDGRSGGRHRGLLTADDMARWQPRYEEPLTDRLSRLHRRARPGRGARARSSCSSWRCCRASTLTRMDPTGPDFVHTVTECAKLAFADREAWYGDPDFVDVPIETLLSRAYADERRKLVGDARLAGAAARRARRAARRALARGRQRRRAGRGRPASASRHRAGDDAATPAISM